MFLWPHGTRFTSWFALPFDVQRYREISLQVGFIHQPRRCRCSESRSDLLADAGLVAVLLFVGLGLWLESYAAALCAVIPVSLMVIRLHLEDRFLRRELPGYNDYTMRVPHRLIPRVW